MSVIVAIADAVVTAINAASLSLIVTAERVYVPAHELTDLAALKVSVVPTGITATPLTRGSDDFAYTVDVGIQKRAEPTNDAVDPLVELAEEIADVFRNKRLAAYPDAKCTAVTNAPVYVPGHLDDQRVFTSVVSLTFNVPRATVP